MLVARMRGGQGPPGVVPGEPGIDVGIGGDVLGVIVADESVAQRAAVAEQHNGDDGKADGGATQAYMLRTSGRRGLDFGPLGTTSLGMLPSLRTETQPRCEFSL